MQFTVRNIIKHLCCINLTIAARLIGLIGVSCSLVLGTALYKDRSESNFDSSRTIALILGLDWKYINHNISITSYNDPDGSNISMIATIYASIYLVASGLLIYSTIVEKRIFTIPWLICELLASISKIISIIYHLRNEDDYDRTFLTGSSVYLAIMTWWWIIVFGAQLHWRRESSAIPFSLFRKEQIPSTSSLNQAALSRWPDGHTFISNTSIVDSPLPYHPNTCYPMI